MDSSSSTTMASSRSASPDTPDSDSLENIVAIQDPSNPWFLNDLSGLPVQQQEPWQLFGEHQSAKLEETDMLRLDELLDEHAFDNSPSNDGFGNMSPFSSHYFIPTQTETPPEQILSLSPTINHLRPVPPPTSVPRKKNAMAYTHKVVKPPKASCYNLPIMFPSMSDGVTKSRVETQVRVTVDLADLPNSLDPNAYDRIGSWKWLKLPPGISTKRRPRKLPKLESEPEDTLQLSVHLTCATPPHNPVLSCSSCQAREAKRVAKKIAARVRPQRSDSESGEEHSSRQKGKQHEDTTSIIQFNCAEQVEFLTGSAVLPIRITCYCRHHREKTGFIVHFTMMDHNGRIVGTGSTKPIMITDDHKTTSNVKHYDSTAVPNGVNYEWSQVGGTLDAPDSSNAPSKRQRASTKRSKPYDSSAKPSRVVSRETSVSSVPSPLASASDIPSSTRATTPSLFPDTISPLISPAQPLVSQQIEPLGDPANSVGVSSFMASPLSTVTTLAMPGILAHPHPMSYMFFDHAVNTPPQPTIQRLIPNCGPTHGGIEVTILGANFHANTHLRCIFGDVAATSTQRWSDNALVCILPPRATPGVVAVWFEGFEHNEAQPHGLFTYSDESDRALMELALQVVGLKMTGKIEDAKNVAMRIVGSTGDRSEPQVLGSDNAMQLASSLITRDLRPVLLMQANDGNGFESVITKFLSILDTPVDGTANVTTSAAISHTNTCGQTLLHLAAVLGFASVLQFLVGHGVDLDIRDRNGYTALHFAAFAGSRKCVKALLDGGADGTIVNSLGKTPMEIGEDQTLFEGLGRSEGDTESSGDDDEEAHWGDGEEDAIDCRGSRVVTRRPSRRFSNRISLPTSRSTSPPPLAETTISEKEKLPPMDSEEEKQKAWFNVFQKAFSQLPGSPLPLPTLPHIMPWHALPQFPTVFPVVVPEMPQMPQWPFFHVGTTPAPPSGDKGVASAARGDKVAQEWGTMWEKWFTAVVAATVRAQQQTEMPPPEYTPRASDDAQCVQQESPAANIEELPEPGPSTLPAVSQTIESRQPRRSEYNVGPPPTEQDVNAYTYQRRPSKKKHDRMLIFFWIPILLISLIWAFHSGVKIAFQTMRASLPLNNAGLAS